MINYSNPLCGGGSSTATLPDQISNLVCVGGTDGTAGTTDVSFTEVPATSFDLLKYYILIYKAGGIPQTPFDGTRITLPKGTAGAKLEHTITGLTFDRLYGIRIYPVSVKNQYQTLAEGATATATPAAGIKLGSLSIGDRIALPVVTPDGVNEYGNEIVFKVIDKNHQGYPSNSVTLMTDKIITLKCFDAKEPSNRDSNRRSFGNNRYIYSNIRQWLNSNASAGRWYSAQHSADAPPNTTNVWNNYNEYEAETGFLKNFSANIVSSLLVTTITVGKADVDGGGTESCSDKIFLASCTEMGLSGDHTCGTLFSMFNSDTARQAYPTAECVSHSEYKDSYLNTSLPWGYLLRDAWASDSYGVRYVHSSGTLRYSHAISGSRGVRPLCNLSQDFLLKTEPRADGIYEVIK